MPTFNRERMFCCEGLWMNTVLATASIRQLGSDSSSPCGDVCFNIRKEICVRMRADICVDIRMDDRVDDSVDDRVGVRG